MNFDFIIEIGINENGGLYLKPESQKFPYIWRAAAEVNRDEKREFLYSPKPREWSYMDWFKHIVAIVKDEYSYVLKPALVTSWVNVSDELKSEIERAFTAN